MLRGYQTTNNKNYSKILHSYFILQFQAPMKICLSCTSGFNNQDWVCPQCGKCPEKLDGKPFFAPELAYENDGFPADSFDFLFEVEATNFWFRARNELIIWALKTYFPQTKNFLEIGCGTGYVLSGINKQLPAIELWGSEIYKSGIEHAGERLPTANIIQLDARNIPFDDEFDVIGAFDVLEHVKEDEAVLSEIRRSLKKPKGGLILTVPQHRFLWSPIDELSCHHRRYESQELAQKLCKAGFNLIKITSFVSLLLPLMMLSRLAKRRKAKNLDPHSELRIPALLNKLLEATLTIERTAIKAGASLPVGGSLLAVASLKIDASQ